MISQYSGNEADEKLMLACHPIMRYNVSGQKGKHIFTKGVGAWLRLPRQTQR